VAEQLPNGKRAIAGAERIILWSSIVILVLASIISYVRTTTALDADLDRNCRLLSQINAQSTFLVLTQSGTDQQTAQTLRESLQSVPQEICG
jgi:hypothetical protein